MENFTSTIDLKNNIETMVQEGFENALVVNVDEHWSHDDLNGTWGTEIKKVVALVEVAEAYHTCRKGLDVPYSEAGWPISDSYYWRVRRDSGSLYPWPLLFATREERLVAASEYNNASWMMFYEGLATEPKLVDCPSDEEIQNLLDQIEQLTDLDGSPWDHLDPRGGLTP